jgi:MFS family permease
MAISSGIWYSASVFFVALIEEFGWDYASTAGIFSIFTVLYGVWSIPVGFLVDRFGPRRVVLAGDLLLVIALAANGSAGSLWHLNVTHGVLASLGLCATSSIPVYLVLTRQFCERRGLALGIASAGVGIGILVIVPLTQVFIEWWGWRVAYLGLAAIAAAVILPIGFFALDERGIESPAEGRRRMVPSLPDGAQRSGREWTLGSAFCSREFWLLTAAFVFLNAPTHLVLTHHVAHLIEAGQPKMLVAGIVGLVGLFSIPGKIAWGYLSDRWWTEVIYLAGAVGTAVAILFLLMIGPTSPTAILYGYAILMGFSYAVAAAMTPILAGRFFAGRHFGVILGALNTFYQGAGAASIWLAGYAHDVTGSYRVSFLASILSAVVAVACVWLAAPRRFSPRSAV